MSCTDCKCKSVRRARCGRSPEEISAPATRAFAITPNDGADLRYNGAEIIDGGCLVYVGGQTGALVVQTVSGDVVTLQVPAVPAVLPLFVRRVYTASTCTGLVGLLP